VTNSFLVSINLFKTHRVDSLGILSTCFLCRIRKHPVLVVSGAVRYTVHILGQERVDGTWEGWLEFHPSGMGSILRTDQETSKPNLTALEYWADGLEPVYLEGHSPARKDGCFNRSQPCCPHLRSSGSEHLCLKKGNCFSWLHAVSRQPPQFGAAEMGLHY